MSFPVMSAPNPRKRPAPGASPMVTMTPLQQQPYSPNQPDRVIGGWTGAPDGGSGFVEPQPPNVNSFTMMSPPGTYGPPAASTALARRPPNRALVHPQFDPEAWGAFAENNNSYLQPQADNMSENEGIETIERLEERALRAKKEAQAKRKQIPPFVQKLSSFLDESRNTDLIRWSEDGDSFIVLDEDEFAKTLIPELFKHNNYASFVRQLNMYGFHKRVGLTDNSMKASERKNKSPSEYYNPYFRRGHPNLLWLINKPKNSGSKKKKKDDAEPESDDDGPMDEVFGPAPGQVPVGRVSNAAQELGPLQKKDLVQVKTQIERLQQQQVAISSMINKLRQEHQTFVQQAHMFQDMHSRHENSINAILNFLANVFRKSLEEQGGVQSVQDLLQSILPNAQTHPQPQMPQGTVVDLGDFVTRQAQAVPNTMGTPKRQQRLLPPVPIPPVGKASTVSPSTTAAPTPQAYQGPQVGSVTELFDTSPADTTSPAYIKDELRTNPHEGMMKIIHDTNAVNTSGIDLPSVAAKTPVAMNSDQRNKMLNMMAGRPHASVSPPRTANGAPVSSPVAPLSMSPPPGMYGSGLSLSPVLGSMPPPSLHDLQASQSELDALQQLSNDQANSIHHLSSLLAPLSPSGRVPGVEDPNNPGSYFDDLVSEYLDPTAYTGPGYDAGNFGGLSGTAANTDGNDFNFALDGNGDNMGQGYVSASAAGPGMGYDSGRVFETSSADTPSSTGTEEIPRLDVGSPERDPKRRRKA